MSQSSQTGDVPQFNQFNQSSQTHERITDDVKSGFTGLLIVLLLLVGGIVCASLGSGGYNKPANGWLIGAAIAQFVLMPIMLPGLFVVNPKESRVLVLFGIYKGTVKRSGFFWVNPFTIKHKLSLRARNLNGDKLKVNDAAGNPIEIAAVVVWEVTDTYAAKFDVEDYEEYVHTQSESAIRKLTQAYHYDGDEGDRTLRGDTEEVNEHLRRELKERVNPAGVNIIEARISHLAYAPEIAQAMLQRQQATAVVAARTKIVEGAVGMVELALDELSRKKVVELDDDRRATMVSNLLVVLCSDRATPVVNAGTLYQ